MSAWGFGVFFLLLLLILCVLTNSSFQPRSKCLSWEADILIPYGIEKKSSLCRCEGGANTVRTSPTSRG